MDTKLKVQSITIFILLSLSIFTSMRVAVSAQPHGYISIAFDDGTQSQYDYAFPALQNHTMKATYYIITNDTGKSSYMTIPELQNLQGNGSEIGSHSDTHADFSSISQVQMQQECQVSKQKLQSWGLNVTNFAYPYGSRTAVSDAIVAQYYRSTRGAYVPPYIMTPPVSGFVLPGDPGEQTTTNLTALDILKNYVYQVATSNGGWEIIFFHNVMPDPTSALPDAISLADFQSFLNYVDSEGVTTLTVNQGIDLLSALYSSPSVSITPSPTVGVNIGQSQIFTSAVSGGRAPYTYQWYLNSNAVASSNSFSWTFTPTQLGSYQVNFQVTDSLNNVGQSNIVNVQVYNHYSLSMATNFGTVSPTSGGYDVGSTISISATPPTENAGERYVFQGWTGTGIGSYTGTNNPATVTMTDNIAETANWKIQYQLTVSSTHGSPSPSSGWYDSGSSVTAFVSSPVTGSAGIQYVCSGWSGAGSVPASGHSSSFSFSINSPSAITWNWQTLYKLNLTQSGVGSDFSGTVLTVNGTNCGVAGYTTWANANDVYTFNYGSQLLVAQNSKQYILTGIVGNVSASSVTVSQPTTITGNYKTQYYFTVTSDHASSTVTSQWYDNGTSVTDSVSSSVAGSAGVQYVCLGWSGQGSVSATGQSSAFTFTINAPSAVTWNWQTQYYLTVSSMYGTVGGLGWYNAGSSAYATVSPTSLSDSEGNHAFTNWSGDTSGTTSSSNVINMDGPKTATADWQTQPTATPSATSTPVPTPMPTQTAAPTPTASPTTSPTVTPTQTPPSNANSGTSVPIILFYGSIVTVVIIVVALIGFMALRRRK